MSNNKLKINEYIQFLINFAIVENKNINLKNPYIYDYISLIIELSKKINKPLSKEFHSKICKNCLTIRNSENTLIRFKNLKKNNKIYKYKIYNCLVCGYIKKINLCKK
ncbi:MAG: hypothetical protein PHR26_01960 [Candidatus ainarchaeum sp.]|nr:hypothetical protein [Candidatus ainarchaeum sp.]MDD3976168.1 hypothetical protein [Candidatus ainarchaeum sp.]